MAEIDVAAAQPAHKLRSEGLAQLLIEHDVQMMVDTCDHLFAVNFGRLLISGDPHPVVGSPEVQEAFLGKQGGRRSA